MDLALPYSSHAFQHRDKSQIFFHIRGLYSGKNPANYIKYFWQWGYLVARPFTNMCDGVASSPNRGLNLSPSRTPATPLCSTLSLYILRVYKGHAHPCLVSLPSASSLNDLLTMCFSSSRGGAGMYAGNTERRRCYVCLVRGPMNTADAWASGPVWSPSRPTLLSRT